MPILAPILAWFGTFLASSVARFVATKILLTALFVVVLPIVLNNLIVSIMTAIYNKAIALVGSSNAAVIQVTGLGAYICNSLSIPLIITILLGAVSVSFTLNLLRIK